MNRTFEVELYEERGIQFAYISTDGASGEKHQVDSMDEVSEVVSDYLKQYEDEME